MIRSPVGTAGTRWMLAAVVIAAVTTASQARPSQPAYSAEVTDTSAMKAEKRLLRRRKPGGTWYDETRFLYHEIPVAVRFTPPDEDLAAAVWAYLDSVDDTFNAYRDDSEIGRVNALRMRERVRVSDDLARALRHAKELHRLTGGAFDVTVGPVRALWKDAAKSGKLPTGGEIEAALAATGLDKIRLDKHRLDGDTLTVEHRGVRFDFGGLVKGMAVDRAVAMIHAAGRTAALVQVGGETGTYGISRRGKPHVVGIQHPTDPRGLWGAIVDPGTGLSVSTSGNYQQPVVIAGSVFYHIVDPGTGRPVDTRTLSVTVAFPATGKNWLADGLATAGAVMGHEKALPLIERLGGEALFIIMEEGRPVEHYTSGWDGLVHKKE